MDSMDSDAEWRGIIQDMDKEVSRRVYNEARAILPFSLLEEDLRKREMHTTRVPGSDTITNGAFAPQEGAQAVARQ